MKEGLQVINFNALKHHFSFLKTKMELWLTKGWEEVHKDLSELGENQFDMYTGNLTPDEITGETEHQMELNSIVSPGDLQLYLGKLHFRSITLSDGSRWIIRESESSPGSIHLHPGRNQPLVRRIKALHLKTAVAIIHNNKNNTLSVNDLTTLKINHIRVTLLGLSPVRSIHESRKITETVKFMIGTH